MNTASRYREMLPRLDLRNHLACVWSAQSSGAPHNVLPDGCIDIVWAPGREPWVAGPDTTSKPASVARGTRMVGLRFKAGATAPVLRMPVYDLVDQRVPLREFWTRGSSEGLAEKLERSSCDDEALQALQDALQVRLSNGPAPDALVAAVITEIQRGLTQRHSSLDSISQKMRLGVRQIHRRFVASVGYGPKMFERIARFQYFLRLAKHPTALASLAAEAGYADQAHLSRECAKLAGISPTALIRD